MKASFIGKLLIAAGVWVGLTLVALDIVIARTVPPGAEQSLRPLIFSVAIVSAFLALLSAWLFAGPVAQRLVRLARFADGLIQDRPYYERPWRDADSLTALERSLVEVAAQFHQALEDAKTEAERRESILA